MRRGDAAAAEPVLYDKRIVCNERQVYWLVDRFHRRDRADETTVSSFSFVCDYYTSFVLYSRPLSRLPNGALVLLRRASGDVLSR